MKQVNLLKDPSNDSSLLLGMFLSIGAFAQQISIKGHVKDVTGRAKLLVLTYWLKALRTEQLQILMVTLFWNAPQNSILVFSFVGYESAEIPTARNMVVTLQDDAVMLEEAVVIGYGTVKKRCNRFGYGYKT